MSNYLTLHFIFSLPWSNLNRNEYGDPKSLWQGGVLRGQLSSQAIKRGARLLYEEASQDESRRSRHYTEEVFRIIQETHPDAKLDDVREILNQRLQKLSKKPGKKEKAPKRDTTNVLAWLSCEEINYVAGLVRKEIEGEKVEEDPNYFKDGTTGSLAIAAFGRMYAANPLLNVEASVAVSPAVSTHEAALMEDYFSAVDDMPVEDEGAGASHIGSANFINGIFYRSVTIDRNQLKSTWLGFGDKAKRRELLTDFIDALIYGLPRGKKTSTAPYVMPDLVVAEEQRHRIAYDFETPVNRDPDNYGYLRPTLIALHQQMLRARDFDGGNFGATQIVSGTSADEFLTLESSIDGMEEANKQQLIDGIIDWLEQE